MLEGAADWRSMIRVDNLLLPSRQEAPTFQHTPTTLCYNSDAEGIATNEALGP